MSSETEPRSFLERRTITFIVATITLIGWNIGLGVNLQAKLDDEIVGATERRALIFSAIVAFLTLCTVILAASLEVLAKTFHNHLWFSTIQGEVCWVMLLTPLQFASSMVLTISRPYFTCPESPGKVEGSSCNGANDGMVVLSWVLPVIFITYLFPLILRTRRLAPIYPPVLKAAMWTVHWEDPGHYYELQSLERLSRWKNPSEVTLPVYPGRPTNESSDDVERGVSTNALGVDLEKYNQPPVVRAANTQERPGLPRYSTIFPVRERNNERGRDRRLRELVLAQRPQAPAPAPAPQPSQPGGSTQSRLPRPVAPMEEVKPRRLTRKDSSRSQIVVQELEVPTSFGHLPVPVIQPPPIARLWIRPNIENDGQTASNQVGGDRRWYRPHLA